MPKATENLIESGVAPPQPAPGGNGQMAARHERRTRGAPDPNLKGDLMVEATKHITKKFTPPPPTRRGILAGAGLILAAGAVTAATVAESPDAELLAECEVFIQGEAEYVPRCADVDYECDARVTPAMQAEIDAFAAHSDAHHARGYWLANCRPNTVEGLRAKARAVLVYLTDDDKPQDMISSLERSVITDLAREGSVA
jgi:hypothetical protein